MILDGLVDLAVAEPVFRENIAEMSEER